MKPLTATISEQAKTTTTDPELKEEKRGFGRVKKAILLVLVCQILAILFAEFMLSVAGIGEEEIYAFDRDLGTCHMPNKRVTWRGEGYGVTYFDADGMQESGLTIAKPPNTYRVGFIGDSMVEGLQVFPPSKFTSVLEKSLANEKVPPTTKRIQVINFGTSGYSTAQECVKLKKQILKYSPDLVVLCYHSRDMFENWSPPDATMTNLRPVALKLDGQPLVIDNSGVKEWMKSPRGKFLNCISWIRNHSRIWGILSATETQLSFNNEFYKTFVELITKPKKAFRRIWEQCCKKENWDLLAHLKKSTPQGPAFSTRTFDRSKGNRKNKGVTKNGEKANPPDTVDATAGGAPAVAKNVATEEAAKPLDDSASNTGVFKILKDTLRALIYEMDNTCRKNGAQFAVVTMPSRLGLVPEPGQEAPGGIDYAHEVRFIKGVCGEQNIPFQDAFTPALSVPRKQRLKMFYALHLTPAGHKYVADEIEPFIYEQIRQVKR